MQEPRDELDALENDYKRWVIAFLDLDPGRPALTVARLKKSLASELRLPKRSVPADLVPLPDTVKKWASRGSIPAELVVRKALARAISEAEILSLPGLRTNESFESIMMKVLSFRAQSINWNAGIQADVELYEMGALSYPVQIAENLDLGLLGLGSYVFGGDVPAYVSRSVEMKILDLLESVPTKALVLEGPPKSGKTRLVAELIRTSRAVKHLKTYWLSSVDGSIGAFLKTHGNSPHRERLIVLDDLQQFKQSLHPEDLNLKSIQRLMRLGFVILVKHESTRFGRQSTDFLEALRVDLPSGAKQLSSSQNFEFVTLNAQLDEAEQVEALRVFDGVMTLDQASSLGAFFASGKELLANFVDLRGHDLLAQAICEASLDGHVLFRQGFTREALRSLARARFGESAPNATWSDLLFEQWFLRLTMGITPKSPHAILNLQDDSETYRLLDFIWAELDISEWALPNIQNLHLDLVQAAINAFSLGLLDVADFLTRKRLEEQADDDLALGIRADLELSRLNYSRACEYAELAIRSNAHDWRHYYLLSLGHRMLGKAEAAAEALRAGLRKLPTSYDLAIKLATTLHEIGLENEALKVIAEIPEELFPSKLDYFLANSAAQGAVKNFQAAAELAEQGLLLFPNNCDLTANLSAELLLSGSTDRASRVLQEHKSLCDIACNANHKFVNHLIDRGELDAARQVLEDSNSWLANRSFSAELLGRLAYGADDFSNAARLFEEAISLVPTPQAFWNLGVALSKLLRPDEVQTAIERGLALFPRDPHLLNELGNCHLRAGDQQQAARHYETAISTERAEHHPYFNLARLNWKFGKVELAFELYQRGLERDSVELQEYDLWILTQLHFNAGDYSNAAQRSLESFEKHQTRWGLSWYLTCITSDQRVSYLKGWSGGGIATLWVNLALAEELAENLDENFDEVKSLLLRSNRSHPGNSELLFSLGYLALGRGSTQSALEWFKRAEELGEKTDMSIRSTVYRLAIETTAGEFHRNLHSEKEIRREFQGTDEDFYLLLAGAHADSKNYVASEEITNWALAKERASWRLMNHLAVLHRIASRTDAAITGFRRSLEINSTRYNVFAAIELSSELIAKGESSEAKKFVAEFLSNLDVPLPPQWEIDLRRSLERQFQPDHETTASPLREVAKTRLKRANPPLGADLTRPEQGVLK